MARKSRLNKDITRVGESRNTTTGQPSFPLRLTENDRAAIDGLEEKIQSMVNKNISKTRIYRAIGYIEDERFCKLIAKSIIENT